MRSSGWEESAELFADLIERPSKEWDRLLDERCAGRPSELRTTVERLLSAHEAAEEHFLDSLDAESLQDVMSDCATELERVGPYRLVREVGRGGMGTVHLAERADGQFEQRAAVKMLKRGMDSEAILGRFLQERQILSRLAHPNIARLLDGGLADDGRPYLVMEYVEGEPIVEYCARRRLPIERRLHLFRQVCAAVEYAHRNLVVHRDLKPSNIVVTGDGVPVLLDFGIAKLLSADDTGAGPDTRTAERWMTPEYAAPEQVRGDPPTVSTDVYQLGCVLYELLSGRKPVERGAGGLRELERDILDREPSPPSAAVAAGDPGIPAVYAKRRSRRSLAKRLEGDFDTIVLKALRKEPERRYASVAALDADVRRHLEGRPVEARPNTAAYRLRRFVGRHRWGVVATAAFATLLVGSVVMLAIQQRATVRERDRAEQAADIAQRQATKSDQVTAFLLGLFEGSAPSVAQGDTITARQLLARGVERLEALGGQPDVQATLLAATGRIHFDLGNLPLADTLLRRALGVWESVPDADRGQVAETRLALAHALRMRERFRESEAIYRRLAASHTRNDEGGLRTRALYGLFASLHALGKHAAADSAFLLWSTAIDSVEGAPDSHVAREMVRLGQMLFYQDDTSRAEQMLRRAVKVQRVAHGERHPELGLALNALGTVLAAGPPDAGTDSVTRESVELHRILFPDGHPELASAIVNRARYLGKLGRLAESEALLREALGMWRRSDGKDGLNFASTNRSLAAVLSVRGRYREAESRLRDVLAWTERNFGPEFLFALRVDVHLGDALARQGEYEEAEALYLKAYEGYAARGAASVSHAAERLVSLYETWGHPEKAEPYRR